MELLVTVVATAVTTSLLTLGVGFLVLRRAAADLERRLEERLRAEMARTVEEGGIVVQERVKQGVLDAVRELPASGAVGNASRNVVDTGAALVQEGLRILMGGAPKV